MQSSYPGTRRSQVIRQSLSDVTRGIKGGLQDAINWYN